MKKFLGTLYDEMSIITDNNGYMDAEQFIITFNSLEDKPENLEIDFICDSDGHLLAGVFIDNKLLIFDFNVVRWFKDKADFIRYFLYLEKKATNLTKSFKSTLKKKIKIFDSQNLEFKANGEWLTPEEALEYLANYHDNDWTGVDDKNIYQYLEKFKTVEERLAFLAEYGDWDLYDYVIYKRDTITGGGYFRNGEDIEREEDESIEVRYY